MSDRDSQIYNALLNATSLDAREKDIVIEAWLLAKKSHDALSSAWTASREKIRRAENDTEDKACWAKFEGVRAQYALIDKFDQRKEQLARRWRPSQVIEVDEDWEDIASEDSTRDDATEASPKAVKVRNIDPQKPVQTSDDMSAGFQASTSDLLQLGLDTIVDLDTILGSTGSVRGRRKQRTKRRAEVIEDDPLSDEKTSSKQARSASTDKRGTTSQEPEKPASPRKMFMRIPDQKKRQRCLTGSPKKLRKSYLDSGHHKHPVEEYIPCTSRTVTDGDVLGSTTTISTLTSNDDEFYDKRYPQAKMGWPGWHSATSPRRQRAIRNEYASRIVNR